MNPACSLAPAQDHNYHQGNDGYDQPGDQGALVRKEIDLFIFHCQALLMILDGLLDGGVVLGLDGKRGPVEEELLGDLRLIPGKSAVVLALPGERIVSARVLVNGEVALDRHVHDGRGKGLVIEAHTHDIAHGRGREALGRFIERDDHALFRVLADLEPGKEVVDEQNHDACRSGSSTAVIRKKGLGLLGPGGFLNKALGPHDHDSQTLLGIERLW